MTSRNEYGPWQQKDICFYCGERADTRDHIPSKVILDEPYPESLAVVPCCRRCNNGFSSDEQYSAVLIECIRVQSIDPHSMLRPKVKDIVDHSPALLQTVKKSVTVDLFGHLSIDEDDVRFKNFVIKLATAHIRYELSLLAIELRPSKISVMEVGIMLEDFKKTFFSPIQINLLPETSSRQMQSLMVSDDGRFFIPWMPYQEGIYSYQVNPETYEVRILIQDFLAIQVLFS